MSKFVRIVIFLSSILLTILAYLEYRIREIPNDYSIKKAYLENPYRKDKILILGSSLSWHGLNPKYFSANTYNAAFSGQSLEYDWFLLKNYSDHFDSLQTIVCTIFYPSFEFEGGQLLDNLKKYYAVYFGYGLPNILLNLYNGHKITQMIRTTARDPMHFVFSDTLGFRPDATNYVGTLEDHAMKMVKLHSKNNAKMRRQNIEYLASISRYTQEHDLSLVLLIPPAHSYYRDRIDTAQLSRMYGCLNAVSGADHVKVLDYFYDSSFEESDFNDAIHLNQKGAEKMTKKVDLFLGQLSLN